MEKHSSEQCPLCNQTFVCKVNSILKCDCMQIDLSEKELEFIKANIENEIGEYACICTNCLLKLKNEIKVLPLST